MKLFLDANVLVSVLNREYPVFTYSARILSLTENKSYTLYTSPICLAIAYYFAEKRSGKKNAREKIIFLANKLQSTTVHALTVSQVIENKKINDFEDGLQYYSALETGCSYILTGNQKDFYFSEIPVLSCRDFMENVLLKHNVQ